MYPILLRAYLTVKRKELVAMSITIIDVAKKANVSKSTVSLVINNAPTVKAETRQRVLEVIE